MFLLKQLSQESTLTERVLKLEVDECMVDSLTRFFKILLDPLGFFKIPSFSRFLKDSSSVSRIL